MENTFFPFVAVVALWSIVAAELTNLVGLDPCRGDLKYSLMVPKCVF